MGRDRPRGLIVDYGGVLTTPVTRSFRTFCRDLGLPSELVKETFVEAYRSADGEPGPVHLIETGAISGDEFAVHLAALLTERSGVTIEADGLVARMFATVTPDEDMFTAVEGARRAGLRTALLSNSWGDDGYPRERFAQLFDTVVISGEVGLRKPDPQIYVLAAERLQLPPAACVFVDDLDTNVEAAEAAGMIGVLHTSADVTVQRLVDLFDLEPAQLRCPTVSPPTGPAP